MAFVRVCGLDELWEGDMAPFEVEGEEILLIYPIGGEPVAFQGICPHQAISLAEGNFDGHRLTCRAHLWIFDAKTGAGINPADCALARYPVRVEDDQILVDIAGIKPLHAAG